MDRPLQWPLGAPWLIFLLTWSLAALRVRRAKKAQDPLSRLVHQLLFVSAALLLFYHRTSAGFLAWRFVPAARAVYLVGVALTWLGVAFALWARIHLGADWSGVVAIKEGQRLVRGGPYALVRHPIYTGILLGFIGTALAIGELRGLPAIALITTACLLRIRMEERWLLEEFGVEYEQYRREAKALIPFLV
jgi:protein-S-isoprenylcysteine O-methyltransferase Ste14